jgi:acyl-CoA thioester hydrolase
MSAPILASLRFRLMYRETDASQVIYFAAWFPWMERLSVGWLHDQGIPFDTMMDRFGATGLTRATTCEYLAPTGVYDEIDLSMHLDRMGGTSYQLGFTMTRVDDAAVVARATLAIAYVDRSGRSAKVPDEVRALLLTPTGNDIEGS